MLRVRAVESNDKSSGKPCVTKQTKSPVRMEVYLLQLLLGKGDESVA